MAIYAFGLTILCIFDFLSVTDRFALQIIQFMAIWCSEAISLILGITFFTNPIADHGYFPRISIFFIIGTFDRITYPINIFINFIFVFLYPDIAEYPHFCRFFNDIICHRLILIIL